MVVPFSFRFVHRCCCSSSRLLERFGLGKMCGWNGKIRDPSLSHREASSSASPVSSPASGTWQDQNDWNDNQDFFRYTAGRFLFEETKQMACRYIKFDMNELVHLAARSVGSRTCVAIRKLPEGQYSKAYLLVMDDGQRVVAKVPNPNAGRPHYTTASEVASLEFVSVVHCLDVQGLIPSSRLGRFSSCLYQRCTHGIRKLQTAQSGQNLSSWK